MARTLSDQVLDTLKSVGVRRIYGIPGDTIDTLMESLRKEPQVEFVVCRHEANCPLYPSPSPPDRTSSRMPASA